MGQSGKKAHYYKMIFSSLLLTLVATAQAGNIAEELTKMGATTLVDLVVKAGLADTLSNSGPFTVFAPDNDAFSRVPQSIMDALASDVELLKKVLLYLKRKATTRIVPLRDVKQPFRCRSCVEQITEQSGETLLFSDRKTVNFV